MSDEKFKCLSGDDTMLGIDSCAARIPLGSGAVTQIVRVSVLAGPCRSISLGETFFADPATATAIASALHVAAAQVRSARGERVPFGVVESEPTSPDMARINGPTVTDGNEYDFVLIHKADVPRLIAELGAWLAAHEVAK